MWEKIKNYKYSIHIFFEIVFFGLLLSWVILNRKQTFKYIENLKNKVMEQDRRIKFLEIKRPMFSDTFVHMVPGRDFPQTENYSQYSQSEYPPQTQPSQKSQVPKKKPKPRYNENQSKTQPPRPSHHSRPQTQPPVSPMTPPVVPIPQEHIETDQELDELLREELEELKTSDNDQPVISSDNDDADDEIEEITTPKPIYTEHPNFNPL